MLSDTRPDASHLVDMIDTTNWWLYNGTQGLQEWTISKGDVFPLGMHPRAKYQRMFAHDIITKFLEEI